jgi:methylated-DNA-[protein]-cysteine S-methyltransferase
MNQEERKIRYAIIDCLSIDEKGLGYSSNMPSLQFTEYQSPLGVITLTATEHGLCGLYFEGQKHWPEDSSSWKRNDQDAYFSTGRTWLDAYFSKSALPQLKLDQTEGSEFQKRVWQALKKIPSGQTYSYAQISAQIGHANAVRAVGAAIGRNPISLIVPCHRVIGSNGLLTGYAGGVDRKRWLLKHEGGL